MEMELEGRLNKLALHPRHGLFPLFEAISNSIHAIKARGAERGSIEIRALREEGAGGRLPIEDLVPIASFSVTDNGIGFTEENFDSFCRADSTHKIDIGGRGVGRLSWIKVFEHARIESIYIEDNKRWRREFDFAVEHDGVSNEKLEQASPEEPQSTTVHLNNALEEYRKEFPKKLETIGKRIVEHFYLQLFSGFRPSLLLHADGEDSIDLIELFGDLFEGSSTTEAFSVHGHHLDITHILNHSPGAERYHRVHFCGEGRTVSEEKLDKFLPGFPPRKIAGDDGKTFLYVGLVAGAILDKHLNDERTDFAFAREDDIDYPDAITESDLMGATGQVIAQHLSPYTDPLKQERRRTVEKYVLEKAPQYRSILRGGEASLESIPFDTTDERVIDRQLREVQFRKEQELREVAAELASKEIDSIEDLEEYRERCFRFLEANNDQGKDALAHCVVHRRVVIDLLEKFLKWRDDGKYEPESMIHKTICPQGITSDDHRFARNNLWLIDETLEYHRHLVSDKPFTSDEMTDSKSLKKPDLVVYKSRFTYSDGDPPTAVVVVEFKQPGRTKYDENYNPVAQINGYIIELQEGKIKDEDGQYIPVSDKTPFYGYAICDITPKIRQLSKVHGWTPHPDGLGYFTYNSELHAYVEVLPYPKIVKDAVKRNRTLFDKLGLRST